MTQSWIPNSTKSRLKMQIKIMCHNPNNRTLPKLSQIESTFQKSKKHPNLKLPQVTISRVRNLLRNKFLQLPRSAKAWSLLWTPKRWWRQFPKSFCNLLMIRSLYMRPKVNRSPKRKRKSKVWTHSRKLWTIQISNPIRLSIRSLPKKLQKTKSIKGHQLSKSLLSTASSAVI